MHDLIQEMGWQVVRQVYPDMPGRYSRLWRYEDVYDVFTENTGTEAIEGIMVPFELESLICNRSKAFRKMNCLRMLIVKGDEIRYHDPIAHPIDCLSNSLQWLDWSYYHFESLPANFQPRKLVGLNVVSSSIIELWKGLKVFDSLTTINLSWSKNLRRTPDLSGTPNLQRLLLKQCISLKEVHSSTAYLRKLTLLNLENCKNLEFLPSNIQMKSLESFNLSGCLILKKFPELSENMDSLLDLRLACTAIRELSSSIGHLAAVSLLDLSFCEELFSLPANVCQLVKLKVLILTGCSRLETLPENIGNLAKLEELYADGTAILQLPDSILHLNKLTVLSLRKERKTLNLKFPRECSLWQLKKLDLSGCNLLDEDVLHVIMFPSLSELNLSRNRFISLRNIRLPVQLRYLNITYCEELKELPRLPPSLRELYVDDFLAPYCVDMLRVYKELYLISFTNSSYELYSGKDNNSSLMDENSQQEIIHDKLGKIFTSFLRSTKVVRSHGKMTSWSIVYPECVIPKWFTSRSTKEKISLCLTENWWNDKFLGFAVCCSTYMGDGVYCPDWSLSGNHDYSFINIKLIGKNSSENIKVPETRCKVGTVSRTYSCCLCIAYIAFETLLYSGLTDSDPNLYCLFEASIDSRIAKEWGVRLVYSKESNSKRWRLV